jgi:Zn ribbon nucleic-acid-binding protein
MEKIIQHICPKCQKKFYKMIYWTGNGIPRKHCIICKQSVKNINDVEYFNNDPILINTFFKLIKYSDIKFI